MYGDRIQKNGYFWENGVLVLGMRQLSEMTEMFYIYNLLIYAQDLCTLLYVTYSSIKNKKKLHLDSIVVILR